jgi:hypothetical protein
LEVLSGQALREAPAGGETPSLGSPPVTLARKPSIPNPDKLSSNLPQNICHPPSGVGNTSERERACLFQGLQTYPEDEAVSLHPQPWNLGWLPFKLHAFS